MRERSFPDKLAVTVYLTEREIDAIEEIAKKEERSRTQQIRLLILKSLESLGWKR